MITAVSENERCEPFDSLFEQRVFNRVVDRGYSVIPQFSTDSYRIDMVIVGARVRLAVECDGDRWHGPAQYADDLARQRDLERAGWHFFRIRESRVLSRSGGHDARPVENARQPRYLPVRPPANRYSERGEHRDCCRW